MTSPCAYPVSTLASPTHRHLCPSSISQPLKSVQCHHNDFLKVCSAPPCIPPEVHSLPHGQRGRSPDHTGFSCLSPPTHRASLVVSMEIYWSPRSLNGEHMEHTSNSTDTGANPAEASRALMGNWNTDGVLQFKGRTDVRGRYSALSHESQSISSETLGLKF